MDVNGIDELVNTPHGDSHFEKPFWSTDKFTDMWIVIDY